MAVICSACSTSLNDAGSRRNLEGESSTEVRCKIKELLCRTESAHDVEEFMKKSNYIYRKCFSSFQKLVKLTKQ